MHILCRINTILRSSLLFCKRSNELSFTLNCSPAVLEAISREAELLSVSRTRYINTLLEKTVHMPRVLTSGTSLDELEACSKLFSDDVLQEISTLAQKERRSIDQMLLHLVEKGIATMNSSAKCTRRAAPLELVVPFSKKNC